MGGSDPTLGAWSLLAAPAVALSMLAVLMLLLRWTFSGGRRRRVRRAAPGEDYLVETARFSNAIEAEYFSCVVTGAGIANALKDSGGHRTLLVPASKRADAEELLRRYAL